MRKLKRPDVAPSCLGKYKHGKDSWNKVTHEHKKEIWTKLSEMQNDFCAYCEGFLDKGKHVDHFAPKGRFKEKIFEWENLFGSCGNGSDAAVDHCGQIKDSPKMGKYDPNEIIKPDVECASEYLVFTQDGKVSPKSGLSSRDKRKAIETIRVFNLNGSSKLQGRRRSAIRIELMVVIDFYKCKESDNEEKWRKMLDDQIQELSRKAFQTALRSVWENFSMS